VLTDDPMTVAGILSRCSLLRGLSPEWMTRIARESRTVRYAKGQRIFSQGEPCPGLFCVGQGVVRVFKVAPSGKEHVLHLAEPGATFAEVAAMGGFATPANAEAAEECTCALVPAERFRSLLHQHHDLCLQLIGGMTLWVRQLVDLLEDVVLRDATARVAQHLLRIDPSGGGEPFHLRVRKKDLASHLNLTSETLSRTLRRLAQCGMLELGAGRDLRVTDPERLREVAEGLLPAEFRD